MANKRNQLFPLPGDVGHDFEDDYDILNFRPDIGFVAPEHQVEELGEPVEDNLAKQKQSTEDLISRYDALGELVDMAEQRIDDRVDALGGLTILLDQNVDAAVIAAMKRKFPDNAAPDRITYQQYKAALKGMMSQTQETPGYGPLDLQKAQENPLKTDFGALALPPGYGRPEISSGSSVIKPISIPEFVTAAVLSLFGLLVSLITDLIKSVVGIP